jgi:7-cyano-7-deazaguanine synthase in queuosine biosynthesis
MKRKPNEALCVAHGRVARFGEQSATVEIGEPGWLVTEGPLGPIPVSMGAVDLLDIATTVYAIERQLAPRALSNRNVRYELTVPLRDPGPWKGKPIELLQELLGFLGSTQWEITLVQRPGKKIDLYAPTDSGRTVRSVALLSGGLDSTAGVGSGFTSAKETQLCSFYTRQKELQRRIADGLKFMPPTQWRHDSPAGLGRSFFYRSFLFLAFGAVTAQTWSTDQIIQFENGILASAIPPVPSVAMTKHAHPRLHDLFTKLLKNVLPGDWSVSNPLWGYTKRQAVGLLAKNIGQTATNKITSITQSCWNLAAPQVFGVSKFGKYRKKANMQCGVCIPCIVRRTALPNEHFAFDLRSDEIRNHPKLGAHFFEYVELLSAIRDAKTTAAFRRALPAEALELMDDGWTTLDALERLWRDFAKEFFSALF